MEGAKLILIGGASHVGKSTLGRRLAEELSWNYLSTDQLARHPGRPWKIDKRRVPADVVDHYSQLSVPELVDSVISHYRTNVWPIIDAIVQSRLNNSFDPGLVFEGSAILPDLVCTAAYRRVSPIWLTAPKAVITERIMRNSNYEAGTKDERRLVDAFLKRTLAMDGLVRESPETDSQNLMDAGSVNTSHLPGLLA